MILLRHLGHSYFVYMRQDNDLSNFLELEGSLAIDNQVARAGGNHYHEGNDKSSISCRIQESV